MKTVSVYTRSGKSSPSSYYRIFQYQNDIDCNFKNRIVVPDKIYKNYNKSTSIKRKIYQVLFYLSAYFRVCAFLLSDIISKPDVIFVSRAIMPKIAPFPIIPLMQKALQKAGKVIWDIDDDIFIAEEITKSESDLLNEYCSNIIILRNILKQYINPKNINNTLILATTDGDFVKENIVEIKKIRKERYDNGEIALLWLATYTSLPFVEDIIPYLDEAARIIKEKNNKQLVLEIVCNRTLNVNVKYLTVKNLVWSKELARNRITNAHIGIYPVRNDAHSLGKGGFKLLQYMSINLATVSSAVGATNDIVENGKNGMIVSYDDLSEWTDVVVELSSSWENLENMGDLARKTWERKYSYNDNLKLLTKLFCGELYEN